MQKTTHKWLACLGMAGVAAFFVMDVLGSAVWKGYNPVSTYVSALILTEAPNHTINRFLMNTYNICYLLFALAAMAYAFRRFHAPMKFGYLLLFAVGLMTTIGYGSYPVSIALLYVKNDARHIAVTAIVLIVTALALFVTGFGYLLQGGFRSLGTVTVIIGLMFTAMNLWHIYAISHGSGFLGLIERLTFYTFHAFTFYVSWIYSFRLKWTASARKGPRSGELSIPAV